MTEPSLEVGACILCEGVRFEIGNKVTLLGVYGLMPGVGVEVADLSKGIDLAFVFFFRNLSPGVDFTFAGGLYREDGSEAKNFAPITIRAEEGRTQQAAVVLFMRDLIVGTPGEYIIALRTDTARIYETRFLISRAPSQSHGEQRISRR
jgi:hypothetical protein